MPQTLFQNPWPTGLDLVVTSAFLAGVGLVTALGYWFMAWDIVAHLRSLRRSLVRATQFAWGAPLWARPRALAAFGLQLPCTEEELMRAYRRKVKAVHPDHGGDPRKFLTLQAQLDEARALLASRAEGACLSVGEAKAA